MYTQHMSDIDILEKTLLWGHLAPTAPDTLGYTHTHTHTRTRTRTHTHTHTHTHTILTSTALPTAKHSCDHRTPMPPIGCVPYKDDDPFVIDECPHVYFSANHAEFQHRVHSGGLPLHNPIYRFHPVCLC